MPKNKAEYSVKKLDFGIHNVQSKRKLKGER